MTDATDSKKLGDINGTGLSNTSITSQNAEDQKATNIDTNNNNVVDNDDDDLDDLDDLLDDFAEDILNKPPGSAKEAQTTTSASDNQSHANDDSSFLNDHSTKVNSKSSPNNPLNDELTTNIEDLIKDLNIEDPDTKDQFEKLVKQFENDNIAKPGSGSGIGSNSNNPQQFDDVMKETMHRLKQSGQNIDDQLKNDPSSGNPEDMLTQLLAGLGGANGDGSGGGDFDMSKLLVDMLEQLSSKEVLYEPIKDLNSKFPDYLAEKKGVISDQEHSNYNKQYEITNEILLIYDSKDYDDENTEKRGNVNTLLESLQELGQPPSELVGDSGSFPGFGGFGGSGAASGAGAGDSGLDFDDIDLPKDFEKDLEEGCKQT